MQQTRAAPPATQILEKIGENFARVGWMYGAPVYLRPPYYPRPRKEDS